MCRGRLCRTTRCSCTCWALHTAQGMGCSSRRWNANRVLAEPLRRGHQSGIRLRKLKILTRPSSVVFLHNPMLPPSVAQSGQEGGAGNRSHTPIAPLTNIYHPKVAATSNAMHSNPFHGPKGTLISKEMINSTCHMQAQAQGAGSCKQIRAFQEKILVSSRSWLAAWGGGWGGAGFSAWVGWDGCVGRVTWGFGITHWMNHTTIACGDICPRNHHKGLGASITPTSPPPPPPGKLQIQPPIQIRTSRMPRLWARPDVDTCQDNRTSVRTSRTSRNAHCP